MSGLRDVLSAAAGLTVVFVVPGIVWAVLLVGLCRVARDGIRRAFPLQTAATLAKTGGSRQAG